MTRLLTLVCALVALLGRQSFAAMTPKPVVPLAVPNVTAQIVATGLGFVSSFQFAPDGRVFVLTLNDRAVSTIKLPYPSANNPKNVWVKFTDIISAPTAGPYGIAFHPDYKHNQLVYIYVAGRNVSGTVVNQIVATRTLAGSQPTRRSSLQSRP